MPKTPKRTTNLQPKDNVTLVTDYMSYGSPLKQAFVIEAINRYAKQCLANQEQLIQQMGEDSFLNPHAWIGCAEHWVRECEQAGRTV